MARMWDDWMTNEERETIEHLRGYGVEYTIYSRYHNTQGIYRFDDSSVLYAVTETIARLLVPKYCSTLGPGSS